MKKIKFLTLLLTLSTFAFAQTPYNMQYGTYSQSFDGLANSGSGHTSFPSGWGIDELGGGTNANGEYRAGSGSSGTGDTYSFGANNSTDRSIGGVASGSVESQFGFVFANNTGTTITQIDLACTMEQWREGSGSGLDSCYFSYSTNATSLGDTTATWTSMSALDLYSASNSSSGALDGNLAANQIATSGTINVSLATSSTIYFKWHDINSPGSDDGLSVDDVSIVLYDASGPIAPAPAAAPVILAMNPTDDNMNVSYLTSSMSFTFDDSIGIVGSGNVHIRDINNSANDISLPVSSFTWSADGKTWTYSSLSLNPATAYAINIDSNVFSNGVFYGGIYNNTDWNFTTIPTPTAVTSLNETFTGCASPNFGVFKAHSEVGGQRWRCTIFGNGDSNAVRMNGYAGGERDNEDWLISPPLDLSTMVRPFVEFYSKLRFPANNVKEFMISTNYAGVGSPTQASWQPIQVTAWNALDTNWKKFQVELTSYKANTFHIAFKYNSDTTDADDWYLDDIRTLEGPQGLVNFSNDDLSVRVLGDVSNNLNILSQSSKNRKLNYTIIDMTGRVVSQSMIEFTRGKQRHSFSARSLHAGMYFLYLTDGQAKTAVKFIVR